ncbi:Coiled-coil domain-containing protein 173 [Camelus dromedarius]|uniref:Coiled-coil domain-containing protein 173 n=3 Tax=Camelus TaxID=9836 RepID=A0A5N4E6A3_CAMDR|nr:coiled-coil domain-containing protein 173 [Camelus ferus]XP_010980793.1 coiled-coil domain-containing protein 173 [Camelus dromedarius]KAB1278991.1 Coiled-coil domain-containing protein 173 [Camelus dromedarius]
MGSSEIIVRFRRRGGQAKKSAEIKNREEDQVLYPPLLPCKVDLRQVTIIPHNEWRRIGDSLDSLTREAARLRAERKAKKEMHLRSQEVVKHWTNTYAGVKEQKLKAKKKRDEEIEAERQILDVEEEIHKQGERKKAIEYAKQCQFYQTERVKNFHSGLLLSRVMKERDAQIEFQKSKIKSDKKWEEQLKLSIEKAFKEEQEKAEKQRRDRVALAKDHLKQIKEHEEEEERKRKHEEKDAEEIKRQNSLYEIEMKKKLEKKKEEINESRRLFFEHMNDKNIIKAVEQQQQEEEDEKIRKFIKAKKRLMQMGKEKEAETHRLMEERRERINNFLSELMKEKIDNEDLIIARDIAEAEAEWEKREREKYEKNKAELRAIAEHRAVVMKNKEEEERQRKSEAKEQLLANMKIDQIFWEHEKEKKRKADKERQEVQDAHIQQMAKNKFNAKQAKQAELEYYRRTEALVAEKEKEFQEYAREVTELESESTNKYIYPLVKAVQEGSGGGHGPIFVDRGGLRPSYQANDITGVQLPFYNSQGSKYNNFQKSKGRLGFTW